MKEHDEIPDDVSEVDLKSHEAEMATLGACLIQERALRTAVDKMEVRDFHRPAHKLIFSAMRSLHERGMDVDPLTLEDELKSRGQLEQIGGPDYLLEIGMYVPSASHSDSYATIVVEKASRRSILSAFDHIATAIRTNRPIAEVEQMLRGLPARLRLSLASKPDVTWKELVQNQSVRQRPGGVSTGNQDLDDLMPYGGLTNGQITLSMAPTGEGKTTWMLSVIFMALDRGLRCAIITFADNTYEDLVERALLYKCGIPSLEAAKERAELLRSGGYDREAESLMNRFDRAQEEIHGWDLEVYSEEDEDGHYETACEWLQRKQDEGLARMASDGVTRKPTPMSLVGWDYAQTIDVADPSVSRLKHYDQQSWLARKMAKFCSKMKCPFIVCVQMSVDNGKEHVEGCKVWEKVCELHLRIQAGGVKILKRRRGGKTSVVPLHRHHDDRWCFVPNNAEYSDGFIREGR